MSSRPTLTSGAQAAYIENLYAAYQADPSRVDSSWQQFFAGFEFALSSGRELTASTATSGDSAHNHAKIEAFINAYRRLGHLGAHLNPLEAKPPIQADLLPENHGLAAIKPDEVFLPANFGNERMTFSAILSQLQQTYCGFIGADFREVNNIAAVVWLQEQMEGCRNQPSFSPESSRRILARLAAAESLEKFLQTRYLGQKRFSLEGLEALIPLLDTLIDEAAQKGVCDVYLGMAHRGRLNVLVQVMQKPAAYLLQEFEGQQANPFDIDGDVKYHQGFASEVETASGQKVNLYLSPNPSHLEAVNPVVEGFSRCRQEQRGDAGWRQIVPVLLHGDAAFIGQGIVAETLNLSRLPAYHTGGTIHVITNNQIGFTTDPDESRSCTYSSDISKVVRAPVFHVNADQPEAVVWVAKLAAAYRNTYHQDVVIDLIGYRRHGHNETDEPRFTQPVMYRKIAEHPSVFTLYAQKLQQQGLISSNDVNTLLSREKDKLEAAYTTIKKQKTALAKPALPTDFAKLFAYKRVDRSDIFAPVATTLTQKLLEDLAAQLLALPEGFKLNPKVERLYQSRQAMLAGTGSIDWAFAELLAFASLAHEGHPVRLSGQDCQRGTFSSRHAVVHDSATGAAYAPVQHLRPNGGHQPAPVAIINSPLSELACLGFEFGYSVANPAALVLWEAQFGDFANGAQIIIDQFLVASEAKWQQTSSLVLLLPHGYEGQGPEHSSARPERFLQCCGSLNIQVCNVSTPAQLFHLLRRQAKRTFRKPLVLMTPKSFLRHPEVKSSLSEFTSGQFNEVIDDPTIERGDLAERAIFCSGKIYYELVQARSQLENDEQVPIIRIEQLYPFPFERLETIFLERYKNLQEVVWVQEEPQNMGAWYFVRPRFRTSLPEHIKVSYIGRKLSGSTAEGTGKAHQLEQQRIIDEAFGKVCAWDPMLGYLERKKFGSL